MAKPSQQNHGSGANNVGLSATTTMKAKRTRKTVPRDSPPQRSSIYRGVTRHRWTGRYEAHLWDKNCWNESQNKKGRQVYLGAYHDEEAAAHAYDLAALKYWGPETILNFPLSTYERELKEMEGLSREEYIGSLRRRSSGFSRGVSKYRGVARHHHNGRWEARIGRVFGNKYLYLGTYATQEEAATAYDMAAIEYRGLNAVTNFDLSRYIKWLKPNQNNPVEVLQPNSPKIDSNNLPPNPNHDQFGISFLNLPPTSSSSSSSCSSSTAAAAASCEPPLTPTMTQARPPMASSALGLLLQSSKFKEMMEMTAAADEDGLSSFSTTPPEPDLPRCSFPEDIQTYFECQLDSGSYEEGDDVIFSELSSFIPPMFQCDFSG